MTKIIDGSKVDKGNYIPVDKDKLKEDQQNELRESVDRYERECLQPLTEAQRENKIWLESDDRIWYASRFLYYTIQDTV